MGELSESLRVLHCEQGVPDVFFKKKYILQKSRWKKSIFDPEKYGFGTLFLLTERAKNRLKIDR